MGLRLDGNRKGKTMYTRSDGVHEDKFPFDNNMLREAVRACEEGQVVEEVVCGWGSQQRGQEGGGHS
eukprot:scaffold87795_cov15-Tisochrysis_lutea.AAC.1